MEIIDETGFQMPLPLNDLIAQIGAKRLSRFEPPEGSRISAVEYFLLPQGETMIALTHQDHLGYDLFLRMADATEETLKGALTDSPPRSIEIIPLAPDPSEGMSYVDQGDNRKPTVYAVYVNKTGSKRSCLSRPTTHGTAEKVAKALSSALHVELIDKTYPWHRWNTREEEGAPKPAMAEAS